LVLNEKDDDKEGCFWKERYEGKVALMLGWLALEGDSSLDWSNPKVYWRSD